MTFIRLTDSLKQKDVSLRYIFKIVPNKDLCHSLIFLGGNSKA